MYEWILFLVLVLVFAGFWVPALIVYLIAGILYYFRLRNTYIILQPFLMREKFSIIIVPIIWPLLFYKHEKNIKEKSSTLQDIDHYYPKKPWKTFIETEKHYNKQIEIEKRFTATIREGFDDDPEGVIYWEEVGSGFDTFKEAVTSLTLELQKPINSNRYGLLFDNSELEEALNGKLIEKSWYVEANGKVLLTSELIEVWRKKRFKKL